MLEGFNKRLFPDWGYFLQQYQSITDTQREILEWFRNLDVQDEINYKLDEMAESGQLEEIIGHYINVNVLHVYDNRAAMIEAAPLEGSTCITRGFYSSGDGGGAMYYVVPASNSVQADGFSKVAIGDNLVAVLVHADNLLLAYGADPTGAAYADAALNKLLEDTPEHGTIAIPRGHFKVQHTIYIDRPVHLAGSATGWDVEHRIIFPIEDSLDFTDCQDSAAIQVRCIGSYLSDLLIMCPARNIKGVCYKQEIGPGTFTRFHIAENVTVAQQSPVVNEGYGFYAEGVGLSRFSRCLAYGFQSGYHITKGTELTASNNTSVEIDSCWAENYSANGYYCHHGSYMLFNNCAADSRMPGSTYGYAIDHCDGVQLNSCGSERNRTGVLFRDSIGCGFSGHVVVNNDAAHGIYVQTTTYQDEQQVTRYYYADATIRDTIISHWGAMSTEYSDVGTRGLHCVVNLINTQTRGGGNILYSVMDTQGRTTTSTFDARGICSNREYFQIPISI